MTLEAYASVLALPVAELEWLESACDTVALREDEQPPDNKSASPSQWLAEP